jgi:hypothetical protein
LNTNDHFSSNWTSWVRGGKSHELVVELLGVLADPSGVADHRVGGHSDLPGRGSDPVAVGQVPDHVDGLVRGQATAEKGGPLPLGEPSLAGATVKQPDGLGLAVVAANGQVAESPLAIIGAIRVLAAEVRQVLVHGHASMILW